MDTGPTSAVTVEVVTGAVLVGVSPTKVAVVFGEGTVALATTSPWLTMSSAESLNSCVLTT